MEVNFLGLRRRSPRRFWRQPASLSRTRCLKERLGACIIGLCPFSFHKRNNRSMKMSTQPSHTNWSWITIGWLHKGVTCSRSLPTSLEFEQPLERGYYMDNVDNHENLTQELLWMSWKAIDPRKRSWRLGGRKMCLRVWSFSHWVTSGKPYEYQERYSKIAKV